MAQIDRTEATVLLTRQDIAGIVQDAGQRSAALATFRTVPMSAGTARMAVISALPTAGFVTEATDATGVKPTSEVKWAQKDLVAEEIAVIVPVHENVVADVTFDLWAEIRPLIVQEFGRVLDAAVFFGVNKPTTWPTDLHAGTVAAANTLDDSATTGVDLAEKINRVMGLVEADGYDVDAIWGQRSLRQSLRGLRTTDGIPIYADAFRTGDTPSLYGVPLTFVTNGAWDAAKALIILGDSDCAILGIRQDVSYKLLSEATVGGINLAERDMVALRAKLRVAFQVAAPLTMTGGAGGYPFAALVP